MSADQHTFGERFASPAEGRPSGAPRQSEGKRPFVPSGGVIPTSADANPADLADQQRTAPPDDDQYDRG